MRLPVAHNPNRTTLGVTRTGYKAAVIAVPLVANSPFAAPGLACSEPIIRRSSHGSHTVAARFARTDWDRCGRLAGWSITTIAGRFIATVTITARSPASLVPTQRDQRRKRADLVGW
jgi:hypothetical protein